MSQRLRRCSIGARWHATAVPVKPLALLRPHMLRNEAMAERQYDTTLPVRVNAFLLSDCKAAAVADGRTLGSWVRLVLTQAAAEFAAKKAAAKKSRRKA